MYIFSSFYTCKSPLDWLLYLADTLAFLPYSTLEEPLFVVHHIEMTISVTGSSLLQQFKEVGFSLHLEIYITAAIVLVTKVLGLNALHDEDNETMDSLCKMHARWHALLLKYACVGQRITGDLSLLNECCSSSQGCMLLLVLKQHLKQLYGLSDKYFTPAQL